MKFLVYDTGLSVEHALCLAKHGHQVKYYTPWNSNRPKFKEYAIGLDVAGLEKVLNFFNHIDWADVICFFDTGMGDIASFLRSKGYSVFGAGSQGEELESHRYLSRMIQEDLGLPRQKTWRIKGIEGLSNFLRHNKDVVVKHDIFRGDLESFVSKDFSCSEQLLRDLEEKVGPFSESIYFMVEEKIDGIEPGFDLIFNGEKFIEPYLYGYEFKGAYIGCVSSDLPGPLQEAKNKLEGYLKKINYRAAFSTEFRLTPEGKAYMIDVTARMPYPLSLGYCNLYDNFDEIVYKVALRENVEARPLGKYMACLPLSSEYGLNYWTYVDFPKRLRDNVKIQNLSHDNYFVPGLPCCVNAVAVGDSEADVFNSIKKTVKEVSAHDLDGENAFGSIEVLSKTIEDGRRDYGIVF